MLNRILRTTAASMALVFTAGCLDSTEPLPARSIEETNFATSLGVDLGASTKTTNGAYYRDLTVGTGAAAANGQQLDMRYTGWLANGQQFDTNANSANPFSFTLGSGQVIRGWDETIPGMRVGGRRQLILPPHLAYGPFGSGPIPGNAVLVFNVELVAAR